MTTPDACPHCGATARDLARASARQVREMNAAQRGRDRVAEQQDPIQITAKVMLNDKELASMVNDWNAARARRPIDPAVIRQIAAAGTYRYRWSWWRFTFTVRR